MKFIGKIVIVLSIILLGYGIYASRFADKGQNTDNTNTSDNTRQNNTFDSDETNSDNPRVSVVAQGLDTPWAIAFLPDGDMLVTEREGTIRLIKDGTLLARPVVTISSVKEIGEGGLQGIAVHPDFDDNNFVYVYYTYSGESNSTLNRVSRFTFTNGELRDENIIVDSIPGAPNHDGGRIKFGPDQKLYITTGDAQEPSLAQDTNSLAGKILRVNDDGSAADGNPFNNLVYSHGHRNPQGIVWDESEQLWSTEHGPSGAQTGNDEFNKIEIGKNYGWPEIKGTDSKSGMETPVIESGFLNAWAPAGVAYLEGRFFFAGLRGSALYELDETGQNLKTHLKGEYGRLREVISGMDGMLYVTTSNHDGRGKPNDGDDKILKVDITKL